MATLLYFDDEREPAQRLAQLCKLPSACIESHRFPDDELRLRLPVNASGQVDSSLVIYRGLDHPNDKLISLLLAASEARSLGVQRILLVSPYLAYMRQDIAFHPGEVISQKRIGHFLSTLVDGIVTVDPHLHRISRLEEAVPLPYAVTLSGAPALSDWIANQLRSPLLIGPDAESEQWVQSAAARHGWDFGVCTKVRRGDHAVEIELPDLSVKDREVVLLDDVASSGRTLAVACRLLLNAGAASVDVAVTHALFAHDAQHIIHQAGVRHIWSTDCIPHPSNTITMAPHIAQAVNDWVGESSPKIPHAC
ncbi:ribose-phosphate pyrophosphokinase [Aquabacterium sp.]|uniref:ribose-phosphate pyrophosphokinase n=1 Tax=Aquabacterium sp. TaxID=1872578 RepID=UPI002E30ED4E|nr:ribose-phosphate pyrophosphokinase [Aquabacterium sp.]HEX5310764.1 ribose-phosphate pyrophosphokinase [Aquabacterium sp.]